MFPWQHLFSKKILIRGKEYFRNNAVKKLTVWAGTYRASVAGRDRYDVRIVTAAGKIRSMSCTCPYAEDGNRCKHMAAVLYAIGAAELTGGVRQEAPNAVVRAPRERKKTVLFPASDPADENYRYFRMEKITEDLTFYEDTVQEANRLLESGEISDLQVEYGYVNLPSANGLEGHATMQYGKPIYGFPAVEVFFRADSVRSLRCRVDHCRASAFAGNAVQIGEKEPCVHETALLIALGRELERTNFGDVTDRKAQWMINGFANALTKGGLSAQERDGENTPAGRLVSIVPRLREQYGSITASFRIGADGKFLLVKDLEKLVEAVENRQELTLGKTLSLNFAEDRFDENAQRWYDYVNRYVQDEQSRPNGFSYRFSDGNPKQQIPLRASNLDEFYELGAASEAFLTEEYSSRQTPLLFTERVPQISLSIVPRMDRAGRFEGVSVTGQLPQLYKGAKYQYSLRGNELSRSGWESIKEIRPLLDSATGNDIDLTIGRRNLSGFWHNILPILRENCVVSEPEETLVAPYLDPEAEFCFYLDAVSGVPVCIGKAFYGEREENLADWQEESILAGSPGRDAIREQAAFRIMREFFPVPADGQSGAFACSAEEESIYRTLTDGIDALWRTGRVMSTPAFDALKIRRKVSVRLGVSLESDLMDLRISSGDISLEELLEILDSYRLKKKYHRLKSGEFVNLDETIAELSAMVSALRLSPREFIRGNMHLPAYRALYLDKMLEQAGDIRTSRDARFRTLVKNFKTVEDSDFEVPESLRGVLRGYQAYGYKWLRTLASCGFGGILADDMGLGKTLQMISVLQAEKDEGTIGTSLVVCPASLVYNWVDEFARFAPELSVCPVVGTQGERTAILQKYAKWDVLVTSYDLLKRDAPQYEDLVFLYEVLDEAQYIKNHSTSAAKSVKILKSRHRFALTGTPIENRLSELWSIFDFLMPGFLYGYDVFRKDLETPIVKKRDEEASSRLRRMVSPFVLRRVKADVLKDLPEKVEETRVVRLEETQQKLYDAQVLRMKEMIASTEESELGRNRIRILAELTRIRQICCDPALLFEDYTGGSAKREACVDLIRSAIEGEHRILVFSQFTSMLALLKEDLAREKIDYYELTGATPKQERLELVSAFNSGSVPVFLISLKAGGTGLNLTGADIVIHYDPWWNAAAQNQATDRTHRIGQTKIVTVFKLIAKNSIEEKIQKMQELKLSLADEIISSDASSLGTLNREELLALLE